MDRIKIIGGNRLNGIIPISGAKNAALPLMIASLLTDETVTLENLPKLADIEQLFRILKHLGVDYTVAENQDAQKCANKRIAKFSAAEIVTSTAPYELVSKMRASFWVIGPLLARLGEAIVSLPGGCAIGTRPVDLILQSLEALGAEIHIENGYAHAKALHGLRGASYRFPKVTVGGTHVLLMAASLARGKTIIDNAAEEPEVVNLAQCLNEMGAKITGAGTDHIEVEGVQNLGGARVKIISDRIETGTYAMAVAMTGGNVLLEGADAQQLRVVFDVLQKTGLDIQEEQQGVRVIRGAGPINPVDIETKPYPGFPTDLQAQFMALMTRASGVSQISETIFENRFMHVQELARLGAHISLSGQTATVQGVGGLQGAQVMATDLRASVSLVIAALAAQGETTVNRVYHLDRGFENLEAKLSNCGAHIRRVHG